MKTRFRKLESVIERHGGVAHLAEALGITVTAVGYWKRGERQPSAEIARLAYDKLGIPPHEMRPDLWDPPCAQTPLKVA
jgi:transcriptional regulator with XRE-family HTH domain